MRVAITYSERHGFWPPSEMLLESEMIAAGSFGSDRSASRVSTRSTVAPLGYVTVLVAAYGALIPHCGSGASVDSIFVPSGDKEDTEVAVCVVAHLVPSGRVIVRVSELGPVRVIAVLDTRPSADVSLVSAAPFAEASASV